MSRIKCNKIPAFSIMETIVAMAVSAIVIGIIFIVFSIVSERMLDFKNQNQLVNDMNRLTYSVNKDIFDMEKMNGSGNEIIFSGYAGNVVRYRLGETNILRESQAFTDTFQVKTGRFRIDSVQNASKKAVFLRLALQIEVNEKPTDLKFYKRVYPAQLLQNLKP